MTVRRVGPAPEEAPPHRTELGRVLVTIDDLKALMEFLTRDCERSTSDIKVEFDGGDFTEPEDLRTLSDMETESIRLKSSKVEVVLSPSVAFAVGDRQESEDVYRVWGRARQTRIKPRQIQSRYARAYLETLTVGLVCLFVISIIIRQPRLSVPSLIFFVVTTCTVLLVSILTWRSMSSISYAVVIPKSLAEHRQSVADQNYPRRNLIATIIIAIVTIAVSIGLAIWSN